MTCFANCNVLSVPSESLTVIVFPALSTFSMVPSTRYRVAALALLDARAATRQTNVTSNTSPLSRPNLSLTIALFSFMKPLSLPCLEPRQECFAHSLQPIAFARVTLCSKTYAVAKGIVLLFARCQRTVYQ